MQYPGGKNLNGVYQRLINQIPPHRTYIETHLGSGAIMRHKRPAAVNVGVDLDGRALHAWTGDLPIRLVQADAARFLVRYPFTGDEFVYVDPPYLAETRRSDRALYRHDYTEAQHIELLEILLGLSCRVMLSGYWSALYQDYVGHWRTLSFRVRTRSGVTVDEWVWMNYREPDELHDYRYLGESFRERERIRRRIERWKTRMECLPPLERRALLAEIGLLRDPVAPGLRWEPLPGRESPLFVASPLQSAPSLRADVLRGGVQGAGSRSGSKPLTPSGITDVARQRRLEI